MFRDLKALRPGNARHLGCLGNALKQLGLSREADEMLDAAVAAGREAIRLKPDSSSAHYSLGYILKNQGKPRRGHRLLQKGHRTRPEVRHGPRQPGHCAVRARASWTRPSPASRRPSNSTRSTPMPTTTWALRWGEGPVGRGHRLPQEGHRARPEARQCPRQPGRCGLWPRASWTRPSPLQEGHRTRPEARRGPRQPGHCAACQGPVGRGHRLLPEGHRARPEDRRRPLQPGRCAGGKGQLDEAIACYQKAIELDPKLASAHSNLGTALAGKGQLDEAIACYRKAIELDPKSASGPLQPGRGIGWQRASWTRPSPATRRPSSSTRSSPRPTATWATALSDKGQLDEAIACYRKAIELDPKNAAAHNNLGIALHRQGPVRRGHRLLPEGHRARPEARHGPLQPGRWR